MGELSAEQAHWIPPGKLSPIDALFAHVVVGEDMWISRFVRQVPSLCETTWAAKTGLDEPHPGDRGPRRSSRIKTADESPTARACQERIIQRFLRTLRQNGKG